MYFETKLDHKKIIPDGILSERLPRDSASPPPNLKDPHMTVGIPSLRCSL